MKWLREWFSERRKRRERIAREFTYVQHLRETNPEFFAPRTYRMRADGSAMDLVSPSFSTAAKDMISDQP